MPRLVAEVDVDGVPPEWGGDWPVPVEPGGYTPAGNCGICGKRRVRWPREPWLYRDGGTDVCLYIDAADRQAAVARFGGVRDEAD